MPSQIIEIEDVYGVQTKAAELKALRADFGPMRYSIAGVVAAMVAGLGLIALLGVTLRL